MAAIAIVCERKVRIEAQQHSHSGGSHPEPSALPTRAGFSGTPRARQRQTARFGARGSDRGSSSLSIPSSVVLYSSLSLARAIITADRRPAPGQEESSVGPSGSHSSSHQAGAQGSPSLPRDCPAMEVGWGGVNETRGASRNKHKRLRRSHRRRRRRRHHPPGFSAQMRHA